jgi:hypothetical protein
MIALVDGNGRLLIASFTLTETAVPSGEQNDGAFVDEAPRHLFQIAGKIRECEYIDCFCRL